MQIAGKLAGSSLGAFLDIARLCKQKSESSIADQAKRRRLNHYKPRYPENTLRRGVHPVRWKLAVVLVIRHLDAPHNPPVVPTH